MNKARDYLITIINVLGIIVSVFFLYSRTNTDTFYKVSDTSISTGLVIYCIFIGVIGSDLIFSSYIKEFIYAFVLVNLLSLSNDYILVAILIILILSLFEYCYKSKINSIDNILRVFMIMFGIAEIYSVISLVYDIKLGKVGTILIQTALVDVLFIVCCVLYVARDKIVRFMSKKFNTEIRLDSIVIFNRGDIIAIIVGIAFGLRICNLLAINDSIIRILIGILCCIGQTIALYFIACVLFKGSEKSNILVTTVLASICLNTYYSTYSIKASVISFIVILGAVIVCYAIRSERLRTICIALILIIQTVISFICGIDAYPIVTVLLLLIIYKLYSIDIKIPIIIGTLVLLIGQGIVQNKYIEPIKDYCRIVDALNDIEGKSDIKLYNASLDSRLKDILNEQNIKYIKADNNEFQQDGVIICDADIEEKFILHKYILHENDRFIICVANEKLAQEYEQNGGSYYRKESEISVDIKYNKKTHEASMSLSNVTDGYHDLSAAVWCEGKSSDEHIWYDLKDNGNGSFEATIDLKKYSKNDEITIHVYGTFEDEDDSFVAGTTYVRE